MQRIYNILTGLLGESKQGYYDKGITQYQFNCPYCADEKGHIDGKYNLEVSFSLGKFHCWSCGSAGPISKLIKSRGGRPLADEYFRIVNEVKEAKYFDLSMFQDREDIFKEQYVTLPENFRKIIIERCRDKALVAYLEKRGITQDIIDFYNIGYTPWSDTDKGWRNRIIIPSYNVAGELNYFTGRTYKENDRRPKYKNCDFDKNKIILHEDKIQWDADIYLVEGAIDCIYYPNSIALMGKFLNNKMEVYNKLYEKANAGIVICLDGDTVINEVKRIYRILDRGRLRGRISYIKLGTDKIPYKDFGEIYEDRGRKGIISIMNEKEKFTEIDLLI